jgi:CHAD domain-containing protein
MDAPGGAAEKIASLGRKRLEKFASLIPCVVVNDDHEAIHDARVASRRTQQILDMLARQSSKKTKPRKLRRVLRNVREILGRPRNLDVILDLVEEKIAGASNPVVRDAWDQLRTYLKERRARALERARDQLRGLDIVEFAARCRAIIDRVDGNEATAHNLRQRIATALTDWRAAIATAQADPKAEELHALRLAGKRLRYRLELLAELDDAVAKAQVKLLRTLQDQLGKWHDRQVLLDTCAKFLRRKDFLAAHPGLARALLLEMERERRRANASVEGLIKHAEKASLAFGESDLPSGGDELARAGG